MQNNLKQCEILPAKLDSYSSRQATSLASTSMTVFDLFIGKVISYLLFQVIITGRCEIDDEYNYILVLQICRYSIQIAYMFHIDTVLGSTQNISQCRDEVLQVYMYIPHLKENHIPQFILPNQCAH